MIKNYFLITVRSMMKNKVFIVINVFGLGIAIAISIVAYFAYEYDATFDSVHKNRGTIYRVSSVRQFENSLTRFAHTPLPLGEVTDKVLKDINYSARYIQSSSNFKREDDLFAANLAYVDPDFLQMFSFDFIAGGTSSLHDKTSIVISESMAIRLFRTAAEAYGKTLTQVFGKELKEVKISGVFREPAMNSSFYKGGGSAYMHFENYKDEYPHVKTDDWQQEILLFVQIHDDNLVSSVYWQLQQYIQNNNKVREDFQVKEFSLDPFVTMAHQDRAENVQSSLWPAPPQSAIIGSMIMSVLILLIACFNLTNTTIAISARRLKEIGIRKVMGSARIQLVIQFIAETTFICLLALIAGLGIADFLIAGWNMMTSNFIHLEADYLSSPGFFLFLCAVLLLTGVLAGSYPAFYISKFKPVTVLKGKLKFGGTNYFTRILLGLQFSISLISIVGAIGFLQNAQYQKDYDLGFDVQGAIVARVNDRNEFEIYRNAIDENPLVLSIAGAQSGIFSNPAHEPVKHDSRQVEVDIIEVGDNYLNTMALKLKEGRDFIKDSETDLKESIIITEKMATLFNWQDPIGKEIIWKDSVKLYVVGVISDVYTRGLWQEMEPMMIRYVHPDQYNQIVVSTKAEHVSELNAYMDEQWSNVFPNRLYNGFRMENILQQVSVLNTSIMYGYAFLGTIALLLSVTGLYTLVSLSIIRRMKEIGIRKIVGASVANITRVVNTEFVIILAIASIIGSWAGFNWCNTIMSTIWKYHQGVNALTFLTAVGLLFTVSFLAIGYKIFSIATMNPVKTLRDE